MHKVLAIAAIALLANITPSCGHTSKAEYRNAQFGWTLSYPRSMKRTVVDVRGFVSLNGVVISNFKGVTARKWLVFHRFPRDGVAVGLLARGGGPAPDTTPPEARFPLSPAHFTLSRATQKPAPKPLTLGLVANGTPFLAEVWLGPESSDESRAAIWKVVQSLRFPPQRTGAMSGYFYVLRDASSYPVNSVSRLGGLPPPDPASYVPPFYLVHAPGGLYAVSWQTKFEPTCQMRFDRAHLQFYCSAARGRWDRMGRVLEGPESAAQYNDSLDLGQAKIGRDGQVLVGNFSNLGDGNPQYSRYEDRFWPSGR
jgi:hypothetical protein